MASKLYACGVGVIRAGTDISFPCFQSSICDVFFSWQNKRRPYTSLPLFLEPALRRPQSTTSNLDSVNWFIRGRGAEIDLYKENYCSQCGYNAPAARWCFPFRINAQSQIISDTGDELRMKESKENTSQVKHLKQPAHQMTRETCPEAVYCKCSLGILTELRDVCEGRPWQFICGAAEHRRDSRYNYNAVRSKLHFQQLQHLLLIIAEYFQDLETQRSEHGDASDSITLTRLWQPNHPGALSIRRLEQVCCLSSLRLELLVIKARAWEAPSVYS